VEPDIALANHLVMGPAILARALGDGVPYAVKVHGSALEYTVKPHPRFLPYAREGVAGARCVLVGSAHTAESLWAAMDDPGLPDRTRLGPPGVDVHAFRPRPKAEAAAALRALAAALASRPASEPGDDASAFARDDAAAGAALERVDPERDRIVLFVGKLIVSKGIDLLIAAWPLVLAQVPEARLLVVGFGAYRDAALELTAALAAGDLDAIRALAEQGRGREGGEPAPLDHLLAFLDRVDADPAARDEYLRAAVACAERVVFTGRLEHEELADVLPACDAMVVPSTFPEAYGMVAAEAAACGVLPVSADHSGLAEVTASLATRVPADARPMLSFGLGPQAVDDLASCVLRWLRAPPETRAATREALVATARDRFSWEGVAEGVIAAARGDLDALPPPV
jgi:glycosyltransferase involved in cell wall biosynthesis